jgi:hypothetical protein
MMDASHKLDSVAMAAANRPNNNLRFANQAAIAHPAYIESQLSEEELIKTLKPKDRLILKALREILEAIKSICNKMDQPLLRLENKMDQGFPVLENKIDQGFMALENKMEPGFQALGNKIDQLSFVPSQRSNNHPPTGPLQIAYNSRSMLPSHPIFPAPHRPQITNSLQLTRQNSRNNQVSMVRPVHFNISHDQNQLPLTSNDQVASHIVPGYKTRISHVNSRESSGVRNFVSFQSNYNQVINGVSRGNRQDFQTAQRANIVRMCTFGDFSKLTKSHESLGSQQNCIQEIVNYRIGRISTERGVNQSLNGYTHLNRTDGQQGLLPIWNNAIARPNQGSQQPLLKNFGPVYRIVSRTTWVHVPLAPQHRITPTGVRSTYRFSIDNDRA